MSTATVRRARSPAPLRTGFQEGSCNLALLKARGRLEPRPGGAAVQWSAEPSLIPRPVRIADAVAPLSKA